MIMNSANAVKVDLQAVCIHHVHARVRFIIVFIFDVNALKPLGLQLVSPADEQTNRRDCTGTGSRTCIESNGC